MAAPLCALFFAHYATKNILTLRPSRRIVPPADRSHFNRGNTTVTLFRLADNLAVRVGRNGIWIWAPDIAPRPFHVDSKTLAELGFRLGFEQSGISGSEAIPSSRDPMRSA